MSDTTNASDAVEPSSELTRLLEFAREDIPAENAWEVLSAKIVATATTGAYEPALEAPDPQASDVGPSAGGTSGATSGGAGAASLGSNTLLSAASLKALGAVVLAGSLGTGAWYQWASTPPAEEPKHSRVEQPVATPSADASSSEYAPPPDVAVSEIAESRVAGNGQRGHKDEPLREQQNPRAAAPSELWLLARARESLANNPERALALCRRHAQLYPQGQLVQEREVLLIEALQRLKRNKEAAQKRQEFGKSFPDSPHQSRVKPQQ